MKRLGRISPQNLFNNFGVSAAVQQLVTFLLSFNKDGTTTVPDGTSDTTYNVQNNKDEGFVYPCSWESSSGRVIQKTSGNGFVSEGLRIVPNYCDAPRTFDATDWTDSGTLTISKNQTGYDGLANGASTITDNDAANAANPYYDVAIDTDTNSHSILFYLGKTTGTPSSYPALQHLIYTGGTTHAAEQPVFNTTTGAITAYGNSQNDGTTTIESHNDDFWVVKSKVTNNGSGANLRVRFKPAFNSDGSATADTSLTGVSAVFDQLEIHLNTSTITEEAGSYNSVSSADSTKLHPTKTGSSGETIYLEYDYWATGQSITTGDKRYYAGTDGHNYALTATTTGTTSGTLSVAATDIGSTVSDSGVTWSVDSYYSNIADGTATGNHVPHVINEPSESNQCADSREYDSATTAWSNSGTLVFGSATGIDGTNSAVTVQDNQAILAYPFYQVSVTSGWTNLVRFYVKKTTSAAHFPGALLNSSGGTQKGAYTINTDTGATTPRTDVANSGTSTITVTSFNDVFWEVVITHVCDSTTANFGMLPAVAATFTGTWDDSAQGTTTFDQVDIRTNQDLVGTPIFTSGGTSSRAATDYTTATPLPANDFAVRFRGVINNAYDSSATLIATNDGVNNTLTLFESNGLGGIFFRKINSGSQTYSISQSPNVFTDGEIYHIGFVVSSTGDDELFFDGASIGTDADTTDLDPGGTLYIGRPSTAAGNYQGGIIDIQLYKNTDRTALEAWAKDTTWANPS